MFRFLFSLLFTLASITASLVNGRCFNIQSNSLNSKFTNYFIFFSYQHFMLDALFPVDSVMAIVDWFAAIRMNNANTYHRRTLLESVNMVQIN